MSDLNEKTALIQDTDGPLEDVKQQSWLKRNSYKILLCCCGVGILVVLFIIFFSIFGIPAIARGIMQNMLDQAKLQVLELQVISQEKDVFTIRVLGILTYDAPIEADGTTEPAVLEVLIEDPNDRNNRIVSALVNMPAITSTGTRTVMNVTTTMRMVDDRAVHLFLGDLMVSETITTWIRGEIELTAHVPVYSNLKMTAMVDQSATIKGYTDIGFTLNAMYLVVGEVDEVEIDFDITVHNPGVLYVDFPLTMYYTDLGLYYNNTWVGYTNPESVSLGKEDTVNRMIGRLVRNEENEEYIADFLSRYMLGEAVLVSVQGKAKFDLGLPETEENAAEVHVNWLLPGIEDELIQDIACPLEDVSPIRLILAAEGKMFNPLEFNVSLIHVAFDAYVGNPCNRTIGRIDETYDFFVFPAQTPVCLAGLEMKVTLDDVTCIAAAAATNLQMWALDGTMTMAVEEFIIAIPFEYGPVGGHIGQCRLD